jgi:hypothetical protein
LEEAGSLVDSAEIVIGEVPVIMRLNVGSERLSLIFTSSRMIVARVGKRGAGSTASLPLWAMLSGGIEGLFKWRKEKAKKKAAATLTAERILAADRDNFPIAYDHIVSVELTITETGRTNMMILTRDDKLTFSTGLSFEKVSGLFREKVGGRLLVKKIPM